MEDSAPNGTDGLALYHGAVGVIDTIQEAFWGRFLVEWDGDLECGLILKAPVCGGDFLPQVIEWSILTTSENENEKVQVDKTQHRKESHRGFT